MEAREISELSLHIRDGRVSPVTLTEDCLSRIATLDPVLNSFITVTAESARREAHAAEQEIRAGRWRGPLHGIPIGLKDLIDVAGVATTAASAVFLDRVPTEDAEVVRRLRAAGAVLLGKQNMHEIAFGGSSVVSHFGPVRNPWDPRHIAGGSSGGSAAAVAAGLCLGAIGTDTGGSVREPPALCGVVGLKPTYGRVSVRGIMPLSPSLDHVGVIARTVADAGILFKAIADSAQDDARAPHTGRLRIGIVRSPFFDDLDAEVAASVEQAMALLAGMAASVSEISVAVRADATLLSAEAYAYHAASIAATPALFQPETLRRLRTGEKLSAADQDRLRRELRQARQAILAVFERVDVLVSPTVPVPAPTIAELTDHPEMLRPREILLLRNTRPFNVWGLPAISLPCGFTSAGLPIGLQIAGPPGREDWVLALAGAYERATAWYRRSPEVVPPGRPAFHRQSA
jgi:aspartyl-tRNA(Asn)/glutamyl-tRNA(Gln) amidotransferase subunit A